MRAVSAMRICKYSNCDGTFSPITAVMQRLHLCETFAHTETAYAGSLRSGAFNICIKCVTASCHLGCALRLYSPCACEIVPECARLSSSEAAFVRTPLSGHAQASYGAVSTHAGYKQLCKASRTYGCGR